MVVEFEKNVIDIWEKLGSQWLSELDETRGRLAENWGLHLGQPFPNLTYSHVSRVEFGGISLNRFAASHLRTSLAQLDQLKPKTLVKGIEDSQNHI